MSNNLKKIPFDLEKAKRITEGKMKGRVVSESGRNVRIICFDMKLTKGTYLAVLRDMGYTEFGLTYDTSGVQIDKKDRLYLDIPTYYKDYTNFEPQKWQPCLVRDGDKDVWWIQVCAMKDPNGDVLFYTSDGSLEKWKNFLPLSWMG